MQQNWMMLAFGASGITALIVACWRYVKGMLTRLTRHVVAVQETDGSVAYEILGWLNHHAKRSPYGTNTWHGNHTFVRSLGRVRLVVYRVFMAGSQVFWLNRRPIWVNLPKSDPANHSQTVSFSYFRGTIDFETLILNALDFIDGKSSLGSRNDSGRYRVHRHYGRGITEAYGGGSQKGLSAAEPPSGGGGADPIAAFRLARRALRWAETDLGPPQSKEALSLLSLSPTLQDVVKEIKFWFAAKPWYKARGIPWRRGYGFFGKPGTGKTSLCRAIAEDLDMPVHVFDLASLTNAEMIYAWQHMLTMMPCIALLEDIDAVFQGRENVTNQFKSGGLTFDCLLNCLDGVERADGLLTVITTNRLEHLDPALGCPDGGDGVSSRPGRIDRMVEFVPLDTAGRDQMAMRILEGDVEATRALVMAGSTDSAAQFQERCFRLALQRKFTELERATNESLASSTGNHSRGSFGSLGHQDLAQRDVMGATDMAETRGYASLGVRNMPARVSVSERSSLAERNGKPRG